MAPAAAHIRMMAVGTHHKCGTVWMRRVFRSLARALDMDFQRSNRPKYFKRFTPGPERRAIMCNWRSAFPPDFLSRDDVRAVHMIRDPRDMLLSGARYHETFEGKNEDFLFSPRDDLGGKSYQEHLRSLPTRVEKLLFEMNGKHAITLTEMTTWDYGRPNVFEMRYEDLIADVDGVLFAEALHFLGLDEAEVEIGVRVFIENSLFGKLGQNLTNDARLSMHVSSGQPQQWLTQLPLTVAEAYADTYGDALIKLGYETDRSWLLRLQPHPETGKIA